MQLSRGETANQPNTGRNDQTCELTKFVTDLAAVASAARTVHAAVVNLMWAAGVEISDLANSDEIRKLGACLDRLDVRRDKMTRP